MGRNKSILGKVKDLRMAKNKPNPNFDDGEPKVIGEPVQEQPNDLLRKQSIGDKTVIVSAIFFK